MATVSSMISSARRPLGVRMRGDLIVLRQTWQGRDYVVVKDPLTLKFFRFEQEEFALLELMDGKRSAEDICRTFASRFAPWQLAPRELHQFVSSLFRSGLLISDAPGQAAALLKRAEEERRRMRRAQWTNILAIRLKGFDPGRGLAFLERGLGWLFSPFAVAVAVMLMLAALGLVISQFDLFQQRLPSFESFFAGKNWIWLGLIVACTKVWHELGHGIACRRMGSQCHSMGVMFLVLMPCLYCDVSDSWTLASKWRRAAIAAAGMYFEFLLASLCVFVWWYSQPGLINMLALNVVVVSSVSTILFNANPLMRYDGYYIVSDLIEVPNLRQKASRVLSRWAGRVFLGLEAPADPFMPVRRRGLFAAYSLAAVAYRWLITFSIFWFLYRLLEPWGLKLIGQCIAMMALYGLLVHPLLQFVKFMKVPGRIHSVKRIRAGVTGGLFAVIVAGVLAIPLPHYVYCPFVIQPRAAAVVYVEVPGQVQATFVQPGDLVEVDTPLIQLTNHELHQRIVALQSERSIAETKHHMKLRLASYSPDAEAEVATTLASLEAADNDLAQYLRDYEKLTLRSPFAGVVHEAPWVAESQGDESGTLTGWYGSPLERRNQGAWLETGTVICQVVDQNDKGEAMLAIDQSDVEFVGEGNGVTLWLRQQPTSSTSSQIDLISLEEMKQVPRGLDSRFGGDLQITIGNDGKAAPINTTYQIRVPLTDGNVNLTTGATGMARIHTGNRTIGQRVWRWLCSTFRFEL